MSLPNDERDHEAPGGAAGDPGQDLNASAAVGRCADAQPPANAIVAAGGAAWTAALAAATEFSSPTTAILPRIGRGFLLTARLGLPGAATQSGCILKA